MYYPVQRWGFESMLSHRKQLICSTCYEQILEKYYQQRIIKNLLGFCRLVYCKLRLESCMNRKKVCRLTPELVEKAMIQNCVNVAKKGVLLLFWASSPVRRHKCDRFSDLSSIRSKTVFYVIAVSVIWMLVVWTVLKKFSNYKKGRANLSGVKKSRFSRKNIPL